MLDSKFEILDENGQIKEVFLKDILEEKNILFFYPRDNTPGCTTENIDFTNFKEEFEKLGYKVIGVSKDSIASHEKFKTKHNLKHILVSDPDLILHKYFGVWGEKKSYGKTTMGVIRSTFVVDKNLNILKEFRNVRAKGHVQRLLSELKK